MTIGTAATGGTTAGAWLTISGASERAIMVHTAPPMAARPATAAMTTATRWPVVDLRETDATDCSVACPIKFGVGVGVGVGGGGEGRTGTSGVITPEFAEASSGLPHSPQNRAFGFRSAP
ncbi:hypothetical protein, partial [Hydrogenophaga sp.]|uniref:hypothetical protein n=1 Tax=Hydrogenophaga sp. TaxID=1904254 RepID=UPI0025C49F1D